MHWMRNGAAGASMNACICMGPWHECVSGPFAAGRVAGFGFQSIPGRTECDPAHGRHGGHRDQGGAARHGRSVPAALYILPRKQWRQPSFSYHQSKQAFLCGRSEKSRRFGKGAPPDRQGRPDDREFSPRRDGAHRPVLRGSAHAESAHHLWQRYRLWPHRPMDRSSRTGLACAKPKRGGVAQRRCGSRAGSGGGEGGGAGVEVSLLESVLDFQFEVLTTYLNDGARPPKRSAVNNAHAYLGAPYGIYATADGYLLVAMGRMATLAKALDCAALQPYLERNCWFTRRDAIKDILGKHLKTQATQYWLDRLIPVDYWCAPVMTWAELLEHDGFKALGFLQDVVRGNGARVRTTSCPIRFDGIRPQAARAAPKVAEDNAWVEANYLAD